MKKGSEVLNSAPWFRGCQDRPTVANDTSIGVCPSGPLHLDQNKEQLLEVMSNQAASGHLGKPHAPGPAPELGARKRGTPEPAEEDNQVMINDHQLNPINLSPILCRALRGANIR